MSEIKWTPQQEQAITATGNNILVSAAAGSGKTAVLVERVIRMLTRSEDPIEIDRLLIVTFTRAAAAQMREKIYKALKERLAADPSNEHLRRQLMKVHTANISTIDSLCAQIVRDHFQDVDIDPGFKMADEAEVRLLKQDVLKDVIESHYNDADEAFLAFVESYIDKNDTKLEEIILSLFDFAESHPEPAAWLAECTAPYREAAFLFEKQPLPECHNDWMREFCDIVQTELEEVVRMAETGIRIACANWGPAAYEEPFCQIIEFVSGLDGMPFDYRKKELDQFLENWKRSPTVKKDEADEDLKEQAKDLRAAIKKKLQNVQETYLSQELEEMYLDMAGCANTAEMIALLVREFSEAFRKIKKEKKIADFSDVAHFALQVLFCYDEDGRIKTDASGCPVFTETADLLAKSYDEIIVDEYQDTNLLQEYLITALSTARFGKPDVFMVGDVKQSIYGFRMACPELFIEKYDCFRPIKERGGQTEAANGLALESKNEDLPGILVRLDQNFRSRKEVLNITNKVFERSMIRKVGGIEYTDGHTLKYGDTYETSDPEKYKSELYMVNGGGEKARLTEAYVVAGRIRKLVEEEGFRYSDIVILSRTSDNPTIEKILSERGIPVIKSAKKGFFDSFEVRLVLNLLSIIDNPYQDIPMAAVLMSPICSMTAADLARMKVSAADRNSSLYEWLEGVPALSWFCERLADWQERKAYMEITEFVEYVIRDSGLEYILAAMPDGQNKMANIDFLKDRAGSFANGPYTGLFNFIRYIRQIKEADMDYGQAQTLSKETDAVQMMTIHGSKGLEFPVVFLVGAGRDRNRTDLNGSIIPDRRLGVGLELRNAQTRIVKKTLLMETIKQRKNIDAYAEELRLLYVAMTRAKEKLIITGNDRSLESHSKKWQQENRWSETQLQRYQILSASGYLQLLGLTLSGQKDDAINITFVDLQDVIAARAEEILDNEEQKAKILSLITEEADTAAIYEDASYVYPFGKATQIQAKISPSQLEKKEDHSEELQQDALIDEKRTSINSQADKKASAAGIERGNAYHRFLQFLDYERPEELETQLQELAVSGKLETGWEKLIEPEKIRTFLSSDLGKRMTAAAKNGALHREQSFLMGVPTDINREETMTGSLPTSDLPDEEILLVQGIIDAYFEEDGKVILVDYKTDRNTDAKTLAKRYAGQQDAYADALQKLFGHPVAEKYLYSIELGEAVRL